jgi:hypothetical protein
MAQRSHSLQQGGPPHSLVHWPRCKRSQSPEGVWTTQALWVAAPALWLGTLMRSARWVLALQLGTSAHRPHCKRSQSPEGVWTTRALWVVAPAAPAPWLGAMRSARQGLTLHLGASVHRLHCRRSQSPEGVWTTQALWVAAPAAPAPWLRVRVHNAQREPCCAAQHIGSTASTPSPLRGSGQCLCRGPLCLLLPPFSRGWAALVWDHVLGVMGRNGLEEGG